MHVTGQTGARRSPWWLVCTLIVTAILVAPTLGYAIGYDQGLLHYLGRTVVAGKWPYADSFDTDFPGGILLHAAVIAVGGTAVGALRVTDWLIQIAAGGILYAAGRRLAGPAAGLYAAGAYAALYVTGGYYYTAQRDGFIVPFLYLSLIGMWMYWADPDRRDALIGSALSAAVVCLIRPTYALVVAMATAAVLARPFLETSPGGVVRRTIADAALFAGIAAAPLLLFLAIYVFSGHGHAISDLLVLLATVYPSLERMSTSRVLSQFITLANRFIVAGAALSLLSPAWRIKRPEMLWLLGLLSGIVVVRLLESKGYPYQYWPAFACLSLLAGVGWTTLGNRIAAFLRIEPRRSGLVALGIVAVALIAQVGRHGLLRYRGLGAGIRANASDTSFRQLIGDDPQQASLAHYLRDHTTPGDSIQLWGAETMILVAADRWSATRFTDPLSFFCDDGRGARLATECGGTWPKPIQVRFLHEFVTQLTTHPPRYIVAHYADGTLAFVAGADAAPDLPELRNLLDQRYAPEVTFGNWTAYRRRDQ